MMASLMMLAIPMMALTPWKIGAFETNKYRNLFVEMGYKQADVDAKLKEVFNDVFRGPSIGSEAFAVYPNPTSNSLNVIIEDTDFNFILFNNVGQAVAKGGAHGMAQIQVEGIAKGIYFLHITSGTQARVVKVVVE